MALDTKPPVVKPWHFDGGFYPRPNGRSFGHATCPHCGKGNSIRSWSLAGSGKRCETPDCRAKFDKFGNCTKDR